MFRSVAALGAALLLVTGCSSSSTSSSGPSGSPSASDLNDNQGNGTLDGVGIDPAEPRPSFTLTDMQGKTFHFSDTSGHPTLLFFGYTNCPDVCPTTMIDISDALKKLPTAVQKKTYVVFVTTDVKHDTGPVLTQWLANFSHGVSAHFVGLRGTQAQIDAAQAASHIQLAEDDGQTHSALVKLYGTDDYAHVAYPQSSNESQLIEHDLPLIAAAS